MGNRIEKGSGGAGCGAEERRDKTKTLMLHRNSRYIL
jgi:hypothetical protein